MVHSSSLDTNQTDLVKAGVIELLLRHVQSDDKDLKRDSVAALTSFSNNAKNRTKIRAVPEGIPSITKHLTSDDMETVIHTCECLTALCDDSQSRLDVIKAGAVSYLVTILDQQDTKVQAAACMSLSRLLQENEGQTALGKQAKTLITKLVEYLQSQDLNLCRVATYLLTIACQVEANAVQACSIGAVDYLIQLVKQAGKKTTKFAQEGLEKLLNHRK
jgi:hypothetical protein